MCQSINLLERNTTKLPSFSEKKAEAVEEDEVEVEVEVKQTESKASRLIRSLFSNSGK
jgi:hypothetical protein